MRRWRWWPARRQAVPVVRMRLDAHDEASRGIPALPFTPNPARHNRPRRPLSPAARQQHLDRLGLAVRGVERRTFTGDEALQLGRPFTLDARAAAQYLGVTTGRIRQLVKSGHLLPAPNGGLRGHRFALEDLVRTAVDRRSANGHR